MQKLNKGGNSIILLLSCFETISDQWINTSQTVLKWKNVNKKSSCLAPKFEEKQLQMQQNEHIHKQ